MSTPIIATFKDEMTSTDGNVVLIQREIGMLSEFFLWSEDYRTRQCQEWADTRGNDQHDTILTFVSWRKM